MHRTNESPPPKKGSSQGPCTPSPSTPQTRPVNCERAKPARTAHPPPGSTQQREVAKGGDVARGSSETRMSRCRPHGWVHADAPGDIPSRSSRIQNRYPECPKRSPEANGSRSTVPCPKHPAGLSELSMHPPNESPPSKKHGPDRRCGAGSRVRVWDAVAGRGNGPNPRHAANCPNRVDGRPGEAVPSGGACSGSG